MVKIMNQKSLVNTQKPIIWGNALVLKTIHQPLNDDHGKKKHGSWDLTIHSSKQMSYLPKKHLSGVIFSSYHNITLLLYVPYM